MPWLESLFATLGRDADSYAELAPELDPGLKQFLDESGFSDELRKDLEKNVLLRQAWTSAVADQLPALAALHKCVAQRAT